MRSLKFDLTTSQDLSEDALSYTTDYGRKFKLEQITIHFSVAVTETVTITLDSATGTEYDTVLRKMTLSSQQDFLYPAGGINLQSGDKIKVQCTNANRTGIAYLVIKAREILN